MIFWGVYFDLHTKVLAVYRYVQILPVFDMFEVKIGGVHQITDCQGGCCPNEDMKVSSEFCTKFWWSWRSFFRCSSSSSEKTCIHSNLQPCLHSMQRQNYGSICGPQCLKLTVTSHSIQRHDLGQSGYNGFLSYNGYNGFFKFFYVF